MTLRLRFVVLEPKTPDFFVSPPANMTSRLSLLLSNRHATLVRRVIYGDAILLEADAAPLPIDVVNDLLARHLDALCPLLPGECLRVLVTEEHGRPSTTLTAVLLG